MQFESVTVFFFLSFFFFFFWGGGIGILCLADWLYVWLVGWLFFSRGEGCGLCFFNLFNRLISMCP